MESITTAMTGAVETIAADVQTLIANILPVALPVMGVVIAVTFGMKFIKKVMK